MRKSSRMQAAWVEVERIVASDPRPEQLRSLLEPSQRSPELLVTAIYEQASVLGMASDAVTDTAWIAARSLVAELPPGWTQYRDDEGRLYYSDGISSRWDHPCDDDHRRLYESWRKNANADECARLGEECADAKAALERCLEDTADLNTKLRCALAAGEALQAESDSKDRDLDSLRRDRDLAVARATALAKRLAVLDDEAHRESELDAARAENQAVEARYVARLEALQRTVAQVRTTEAMAQSSAAAFQRRAAWDAAATARAIEDARSRDAALWQERHGAELVSMRAEAQAMETRYVARLEALERTVTRVRTAEAAAQSRVAALERRAAWDAATTARTVEELHLQDTALSQGCHDAELARSHAELRAMDAQCAARLETLEHAMARVRQAEEAAQSRAAAFERRAAWDAATTARTVEELRSQDAALSQKCHDAELARSRALDAQCAARLEAVEDAMARLREAEEAATARATCLERRAAWDAASTTRAVAELLSREARRSRAAAVDEASARAHKLERVGEELERTKAELAAARAVAEVERNLGVVDNEYKAKWEAERLARRRVQDRLMDLEGNIRVVCRCRPHEGASCVEWGAPGEIGVRNDAGVMQRYELDTVLGPSATQVDVYDAVEPLLQAAVDGYDACIFAYGQTGTGKTHTLLGAGGVYARARDRLFERTRVKMSMLEIYNETARDLLQRNAKPLEVKHHGVPGLSEHDVSSPQDVDRLLARGTKQRAVGSHDLNSQSSRSHLILTFSLLDENNADDQHVNAASSSKKASRLHIIDLAGSERLTKTKAEGPRLKEAQNINRSLSALGDVIHALSQNIPNQVNQAPSHVPYRNSKLTFFLQDTLSKKKHGKRAPIILMLVTISSALPNANETICSLNFARRCRDVALRTHNP